MAQARCLAVRQAAQALVNFVATNTHTSCCRPHKHDVSHTPNYESIYSAEWCSQWCRRLWSSRTWLAQRGPGRLHKEYHCILSVKPCQWNDVVDVQTETSCADVDNELLYVIVK